MIQLRCIDDLREILVYDTLVIISAVFLCYALSWNLIAVIACFILGLIVFAGSLIDWFYFRRIITLDATGCNFTTGRRTKTFRWEEINIQYVENKSFVFGDSEIPGEGVILSANPISKLNHIGAMTYCRFTHPTTSVFIRFGSSADLKKVAAKFVYGGFFADRIDLMAFWESMGVSVYN